LLLSELRGAHGSAVDGGGGGVRRTGSTASPSMPAP
jgi:hypothetical protein